MNETIDLKELRAFAAVAARRSFVAAAAALRMPKATVSRKVQTLEARLGVRLLQRTTRRVSLTEAGAAFLEGCQAVEEALAEAEAVVERHGAAPRGVLRVTAPSSLVRLLVTPILPGFLARYPEVSVQLTLKNEVEDLVGKGVNVALSPWPPGDGRHLARVLGVVEQGCFASPDYLARHGEPRRPEDLARHRALHYDGGPGARPEWTLQRGRRAVTVPLRVAFVANAIPPLQDAAVAGVGIVMTWTTMLEGELRAGRLRRILPGWSGPPVTLRALYPSRVGMPPKVRVMLDYLVETTEPLRRPGRGAASP
jgi:DNA-binding transcriptional LysR family regulator